MENEGFNFNDCIEIHGKNLEVKGLSCSDEDYDCIIEFKSTNNGGTVKLVDVESVVIHKNVIKVTNISGKVGHLKSLDGGVILETKVRYI